jgi:transposase
MPAITYKVTLTDAEKQTLDQFVRQGKTSSRNHTRARILSKAATGLQDKALMEALDVSASLIYKTHQRCVEEGPEAALKDHPRPGKAPKLTDKQPAHLIALACSEAPTGHNHGILRLLADKVVELAYAGCLSQRTPDKEQLQREVGANVQQRNRQAKPVNWRFTSQEARRKLARLYPRIST